MQIKAVPAFKYLGVEVNGNNTIKEEMKERWINSNNS